MTISSLLEAKLRAATSSLGAAEARVQAAGDTRFGDYQSSIAMVLAKQQRANPRQVAQQIIDQLDVAGMCEKPEIAGPGFINFRLKPDWLARHFAEFITDVRLGVPQPEQSRTLVIDFSSPNVAKPMHVGHIRSTILGDALARIAEFIGHRVIRDNHIGDWGTTFGMLLVGWKHFFQKGNAAKKPIEELVRIYKLTNLACEISTSASAKLLEVLNRVVQLGDELNVAWRTFQRRPTKEFKAYFDGEFSEGDLDESDASALRATGRILKQFGYLAKSSPAMVRLASVQSVKEAIKLAANPPSGATNVRDAARRELVLLQSEEEENTRIWKEMIHLSRRSFERIYRRLGVRFDFTLGESFYNPQLKSVVQDLRTRGIATESEGALCVFSDGTLKQDDDPFLIKDKKGWRANPALVQKRDGAANYTTTDLATLKYRLKTWKPNEIIYVTDGRQILHFRQLFAIFQRWHPELAAKVQLSHVWFGSILGKDGKPFKTRSGDNVKLATLLDEAEKRALKIVEEKSPELPKPEDRTSGRLEAERVKKREIARVVGLGAIKYADLLPNRQSDYVFSWEKMLSLQGNTAPYLQYSYVRIRSIFRKGEERGALNGNQGEMALVEAAELALAKKLLQFGEVLPQVLEDYRPNVLANYLYELASTFHGFFESCPVLKSEGATRATRLALCDATARVLKQGLGLLGIEVPERM